MIAAWCALAAAASLTTSGASASGATPHPLAHARPPHPLAHARPPHPLAHAPRPLARTPRPWGVAMPLLLGASTSDGAAPESSDRGELAAAEQAALAALQADPQNGSALLALGLARFKLGRPSEALEALDRAAATPDAPDLALVHYDRGSCLTALGRPEEAEQAFLRAAALDPELAPVAEVSAGLAALDAGALDRARAAADRAAVHSGPAGLAELVADLRSQISTAERRAADEAEAQAGAAATEGLTHFNAERYAEAERDFLRAVQLAPADGMHHLMAGAAAFHLGHRAAARVQLEEALRLGLDEAAAAAAREYLDGLSPGLRGRGSGLALRAAVDTGVDTNVLQSGLGFAELLGPRGPGGAASPYASALVGAAYRRALGAALFGELTYAFDQVAYAAPPFAEDSLQQHAAEAMLELSLHPRVRLSLAAQGDALSQGLASFHGVEWGAGGGAAVAYDEAEWLTARLKLEVTRKSAFSSAYREYSGTRSDATLAQDLRWPAALLTAWARFRDERIGTLQEAEVRPPPPFLCPPAGCGQLSSQLNVIPFAYRSGLLAVTAAALLPRRARAALELGLEWRRYLSDSYLQVTFADGSTLEADHRRREDLRFTASLTAALPLGGGFELGGRYDLSVAASNVDNRIIDFPCAPPDFSCHQLDYGSQSFQKHVLSVSLAYTR